MFTLSSLAFSTDAAFGRWMVHPTPMAFIRPMHGDRHTFLRGPADDLVILLFIVGGRMVVVVHAPGDAFPDAVELQHFVAKSLRQHLRQTFQLFKFLAGSRAAQAISDSERQLMLPPNLEEW